MLESLPIMIECIRSPPLIGSDTDNSFLEVMSYDISCRNVSTTTQLVCRYCIPVSRGAIPHVVRRIDEYMTPFLCHETFTAACEEGASIRTLDFLLEHVAPVWREAVQAAVRGGHMRVLRWMTESQDGRGPWNEDFGNVLEIAAAHGHLELVQWLYARGIDYHRLSDIDEWSTGSIDKPWYEHCMSNALEAAATHGHLEVVQWIHGVGTDPCRTYAKPMDRAVENGHLAATQWLYTQTSPIQCSVGSIDRAARNGHLELLQWMASTNLFECSPSAMDGAAGNGFLEVVKWLRKRHKGCTNDALWSAVSNGHLDVARWLYDSYRFDPGYFSFYGPWLAMKNGHLDSVRWLAEYFPGSVSKRHLEYAAGNGHFDVVMWLHEHRSEGCTIMAPVRAAKYGHLDILQFLHADYPETFTPLVISRAASHGRLNVVLWLLEHRTDGFSDPAMETPRNLEVRNLFSNAKSNSDLTQIAQLARLEVVFEQRPAFFRGCLRCLAETAIASGKVNLLDWTNQFGIELLSTAPIREAVCYGDWRLLEWFHENGFQVLEPDLLELAVEMGQLEMSRWLVNHGYKIDSLRLVEIAGKDENVPLMQWLVEHGPPLSLSVGTTLAIEYRHMEMTWWLAEPDRAKLVLTALREEDRGLLWWLLTQTQFQNEHGRDLIRDAVQCASTDIQLWLSENVAMGCSWKFCTASGSVSNNLMQQS